MREYPIQHQEKGFSKRGFSGVNLDLTVWTRDGEEDIYRIELIHDVIKRPHALIFEDNKLRNYYAVDVSEDKPGRHPSQIFQLNGSIPRDLIMKEFIADKEDLPVDIANLVISNLKGIQV